MMQKRDASDVQSCGCSEGLRITCQRHMEEMYSEKPDSDPVGALTSPLPKCGCGCWTAEKLSNLYSERNMYKRMAEQRRGLMSELRQEMGIEENMEDDAELKAALRFAKGMKEKCRKLEDELSWIQDLATMSGMEGEDSAEIRLQKIKKCCGDLLGKKTANGFTPEQEEQILRETEEALRGKSYSSAREAHDSLRKAYARTVKRTGKWRGEKVQ